jgi:regulation of enolase protein 1 (concanavalin A-like superfamily)
MLQVRWQADDGSGPMASLIDGMTWLNEPPFWRVDGGDLVARSGAGTDFWQGTYYGFHHDDGHFLHRPWTGEFTAETSFSGAYDTLYDQAGLMLRVDAGRWVKCGVELTDGAMHLSVVVTNGRSDWSAQRIARTDAPIGVRLTRMGDACFVQFRVGDDEWRMGRLAWFPPEPASVQVGLAFCSPQREGFEARFHDFQLGPPIIREIH